MGVTIYVRILFGQLYFLRNIFTLSCYSLKKFNVLKCSNITIYRKNGNTVHCEIMQTCMKQQFSLVTRYNNKMAKRSCEISLEILRTT